MTLLSAIPGGPDCLIPNGWLASRVGYGAEMRPLDGLHVVNLGVNAPPNVACRRLQELGATVKKVLPPAGDPDQLRAPEWYEELTSGQHVFRLDLKDAADRRRLDELLAEADILVTSSRPAALERLDLTWGTLEPR